MEAKLKKKNLYFKLSADNIFQDNFMLELKKKKFKYDNVILYDNLNNYHLLKITSDCFF